MRRSLVSSMLAAALVVGMAPAAQAAPVPFESYEVGLHEEGGRSILIVTGTVPEDIPLPAQIRLPAPKSWQLQWSGEILGANPDDDISADPEKTTSGAGDVYTFALTRSRTAQIEVMGPPLTAFDGRTYRTQLAWAPLDDVARVRMSLALPAGARIIGGTEGAEFFPVDKTGGYWSKTFSDVEAGQPLDLAASYALAVSAGSTSGATPRNNVALAVILLAAIVLFGVAFTAIRRKMRPGRGDTDCDLLAASETGAAETRSATTANTAPADPAGGAAPGEEDRAPRRSSLPALIITAVAGTFVVVALAAGSRSAATHSSDGVVSRTFSTAEACSQVSIPLTARQDVDLAASADALLKGLEAVPGISTAALYVDESRIDIGYCDSSASEAQLREALASTGLVTFD